MIEGILDKRGSLRNNRYNGTWPQVSHRWRIAGDTSAGRKIPIVPTRP